MRTALTASFFLLLCGRIVCFLLLGPHLFEGQVIQVVSNILDEPRVFQGGQMFGISYGNAFGSVPLRVVTKRTEQFNYGEKVKISGSLTKRALQTSSPIYDLVSEDIVEVPSPEDTLMQFVLYMRQTIGNTYKKVLSSNSAALLLGIVLGVKGKFTNGFLPALQATGVVHIVAASGMNVTMVGGFFFAIFSKFFKRQSAIIGVALCIGWYVLLSGMQSSILRAGVMMTLSLGAQFFGRQYDGMYALFITAGVMLLFSPVLLFDVGFQLSVASTVGILFIKPLFPHGVLFDDLSTTLAAQLVTLPILLLVFGQYGLFSIVVNILILWTVPFLMVLGGVAAVLSFAFPSLGGAFLLLSAPLLWYIETVVKLFSRLSPGFSLGILPIPLVLGYYLILGAGVFYIQSKKKQYKANLLPLPSSLVGP